MLRILSKHRSVPVLVAGAVLAGLLAPGGPAQAQARARAQAQAQGLGGVTVTAPRLIGREANGTPIERVSMSATVRVADLDLKTPEGVGELNKRVRDVAASLCKRLEADYPIGSPEYTACVKEAVAAASSQTGLIKAG
jgi:UrcA family protein